MTAPRHGPKRASRRPIGRKQGRPTVGSMARTIQEVIDTGGAISVGAVNLVKDTARTAISAAQDVGAEAGFAAVAAVRGSIVAAREIGSDLGRLSGRVLSGTFEAALEVGKDLMDLGAGGAKRPLAKATSQRRSRASERGRTTRRSA